MRIIAYTLLAATVVLTAIILIGLNVDLAVTRSAFNAVSRRFPGEHVPILVHMRDHGRIAVAVCIGCILLATMRYLPWNLPSMPARAAAYLTTALVLGPGLLVNGILKAHWGRPRPIELLEFGGGLPFVNWFDPTGGCPSNCSFVSGESAAAAWLFGAAMFVPPKWRPLAIGAAAAFFVNTSVLRILGGAHFVSDVLIGGLSSVLILLVLHPLFYPKRLTHYESSLSPPPS